jgi:hypothetical protein
MTTVGQIAQKVRSKNAGPFWVTIDIFCSDSAAFDHLVAGLATETVASLYAQPTQMLKRFDIADLNVIKFSFPRPVTQGASADRDMHGAAWATLLAELELP